ncbi:hypothetical protein BZA77DRAFT_386216 [Pyronema omphalodes]|nr:hypothetical protein BZA77DRAFT_386216 [Pyronema omphalodes]
MDTPSTIETPAQTRMTPPVMPSPLSPAEQARIRRERRQAKVREGGNSRLSKITSTQGSDFRKNELDVDPPSRPTSSSSAARSVSPAADPPEIDISRIMGTLPPRPSATQAHAAAHFASQPSPEDELREAYMMDQLYSQRKGAKPQEEPSPGGMDPMMMLMQQIAGAGSGMGGMPPGMEGLMGGMGGMGGIPGMGGMPGMGAMPGAQPQQEKKDKWQMLWTVVHAIFAAMLAIWAVRSSSVKFDGSELSRADSKFLSRDEKPQLFWYFAIMELLLQSGRFILEKGRPPPGSMLTTIAGFLPMPFAGYLHTLARYSVFLWTILADAGVVIFVLGAAAWWNM